MIALEIRLDLHGTGYVVAYGILCSKDEIIPDAAASDSLSEPSLALLALRSH